MINKASVDLRTNSFTLDFCKSLGKNWTILNKDEVRWGKTAEPSDSTATQNKVLFMPQEKRKKNTFWECARYFTRSPRKKTVRALFIGILFFHCSLIKTGPVLSSSETVWTVDSDVLWTLFFDKSWVKNTCHIQLGTWDLRLVIVLGRTSCPMPKKKDKCSNWPGGKIFP